MTNMAARWCPRTAAPFEATIIRLAKANRTGSVFCICESARRSYATSNDPKSSVTARRKAVTVINDDGKVGWKDLSKGEKVARTTQQSFNLSVVLVGAVGTGLVSYLLYQEGFSTDSPTKHFNDAVNRIRGHPKALELLGTGKTIRAFGEPTQNKWTRNRPIASNLQIDQAGVEHFRMRFNVEGSDNSGFVSIHMVKGPDDSHFQYQVLSLDVPGHSRVYLENTEVPVGHKKKPGKLFGIQWR